MSLMIFTQLPVVLRSWLVSFPWFAGSSRKIIFSEYVRTQCSQVYTLLYSDPDY